MTIDQRDLCYARSAPPPEHQSWKEIAAYLGVSVRTAQLWERDKALPLRCIPDGQKSRVFARTEDLDRWRAGMPALTRRRILLFATAGAAFLALLAGSVWASRRPGEPAASHLQNNTLIVLDGQGREAWRKAIGELVRD